MSTEQQLYRRCTTCGPPRVGFVWDIGMWCKKCQQHEHAHWAPCKACTGVGFVPVETRSNHYAIKHPVRLQARPLGLAHEGNLWAFEATGEAGNRVTIIASGERFNDALRLPAVQVSDAEQARAMYLRGEIDAESFESALEGAGE